MNWDAVSAVSETIATIAVVVSLIYLAVQVSQNTKAIKRQGLHASRDRFLNHLDGTTETQVDADIFRKGLNNFEKMSPAEQGCFNCKMHPLVHGFHHGWDLHREGLLPEQEFTAMRNLTVSFLMTKGAQQWWAIQKTVPPPEIVAYLDDAVAKAQGTIAPATERFSWLRSD